MRAIGWIFALSVFALPHSLASAASITSTVSKDGKVIVSLVGEISEGDADALKSIIKLANDSGHIVSAIRLELSWRKPSGGFKSCHHRSIWKNSYVRHRRTKCASACFIVFAAGSPKYANYNASVGVHGASDEAGRETIEAGAATVSMARIVKDLGVPAPIIGKMVVTPPDSIVWLTPDDLRSMGATMTGKPAQVPPDQSASPQAPTQIDPSTRAAIPPASTTKAPPMERFCE